MYGHEIEKVTENKLFGVKIDKLSWKPHIKHPHYKEVFFLL